MTSPTRPARSPRLQALEDHFAADGRVRAFAETNPSVPARLSDIVRWVDAHMREAGLKLAIEQDGAVALAGWRSRFGLTPAECRLANHLLNGGTPATFTAEMRLSPHTVRNHLRSIYAKTNTNRQVSLLQLLLRASGKNP
jgi:DNA-binding CsgD family transcriptional regulator